MFGIDLKAALIAIADKFPKGAKLDAIRMADAVCENMKSAGIMLLPFQEQWVSQNVRKLILRMEKGADPATILHQLSMENGNMPKSKMKAVYVLIQEHYHFPKEGEQWAGDMVAATPRIAVPGTDESGEYLKIQAHRSAREHMEKFVGSGFEYELKEGQTSSPDEYRVWVDTKDPNYDRFVWVVRKVEYRS